MAIQLVIMSLDVDSFEQPMTRVYTKDEVTLGRLESNDLVLDRPEVSSNHARLRLKSNGPAPTLYVTDLGSANGTILENRELEPQAEIAIRPHQRIVIGTFLIKPSVVDDPQPETVRSPGEPAAESEEPSEERPPWEAEEDGQVEETRGEYFQIQEPSPAGDSGESMTESLRVVVGETSCDDLDFVARKLYTLGGRVTHKNRPLAGAQIDAGELGERTTGPQGEFSFGNVPEGTAYLCRVSKDGFLFDLDAVRSGSVELNVDLQFTATELFEVRGAVVHRGEALAGVTIDAGELGTMLTGPQGTFTFMRVPEGTHYSLKVSKEKFLFEKGEINGTAGPLDPSLVFIAKELFTLRGRVLHNGAPISGVRVDGGSLGVTTTSDDGSYSFDNVPEGQECTLSASKDGYVFGTIRKKPS